MLICTRCLYALVPNNGLVSPTFLARERGHEGRGKGFWKEPATPTSKGDSAACASCRYNALSRSPLDVQSMRQIILPWQPTTLAALCLGPELALYDKSSLTACSVTLS
jgi:hypothetical protein